MKPRKILVALDSETVRTYFRDSLTEANYEVICAEDGIKALKLVLKETPDCAVISTELPLINGCDLCHIIKNTESIKDVAVILCSPNDENTVRFIAKNAMGDGFFIPSSENLHTLCDMVTKCISKRIRMSKKSGRDYSDAEIIQIISQAFGGELFNSYIVREAFNAENYSWNTEQLLGIFSHVLSGIFNYDALGIIVNENPTIEFYDYSSLIEENDFEDFRKICREDFSSRLAGVRGVNWKASVTYESIIENFNNERERVKSYELFPLDKNQKYPITVHAATTSLSNINNSTKQAIDNVVRVFAPVIEKHLESERNLAVEVKLRNAFERFLPSKVIDRIVSGDDVFTTGTTGGGEQRKVAVLFTDIRNFTEITEKNDPKAVVTFLNNYFTKMGEIIKRHGGIIDKFEGDAVMALFGIPEGHKYNGYRAANAALEMAEAIKDMDTSPLILPEKGFRVGMGIHYGEPIVGIFGSADKKEYTAIGDDVNTASRIQSLTKYYGVRILLSGSVKHDVEDALSDFDYAAYVNARKDYDFRYLDNVRVRGKNAAIELYELVESKDKYSENFLKNYSKGLNLYLIGNFNGAQDYLRIAQILNPEDVVTKTLLARCEKFSKDAPKDWDGATTFTIY